MTASRQGACAQDGPEHDRYDSTQIKHHQIVMTDLDYLNHAEKALAAIELACDHINDASDADIDSQRTGGMITLTFANRSQIIINKKNIINHFIRSLYIILVKISYFLNVS